MEGDGRQRREVKRHDGFQSTPSAWRETETYHSVTDAVAFQSTPSAWRETESGIYAGVLVMISIHSLRMEGDQEWMDGIADVRDFNPLPPHGGRQPENK